MQSTDRTAVTESGRSRVAETSVDLFDKHRAALRRLDGKSAVVTGGSQGMGKEVARELARLGAAVIIVARDPARTREAIADIEATTGSRSVRFVQADLASLDAVRRAAAEIRESHPVLDILVNNAGGHFLRRLESADGIEQSWAINFAAPFLFTNLLIDSILASTAGRVVNVASNAMSKTLTMADLKRDGGFDSWRAYGEAKLCLVMFTYDLARRLADSRVTVNCLHPGLVATSVATSAKPEWMPTFVLDFIKLFLLTPEQGARTALALAASPDLKDLTGRHFVRGREARSVPISYDIEAQERAWSLGERLTGFEWGRR
jgi:NAD(P)-dependent dehydrogenase (short-subunit alcohol dehydrogenase family)